MARYKSKAQRAKLAKVEQAVVDVKSQVSQQPRFIPQGDDYFISLAKWAKESFETIPEYSNDSRTRSKWLSKFWPNEPYLAGLINSVVQIDRNRGWSLVGGRNQVIRFTSVLHNWQVQPGRASWRDGIGAAALAFYTTDIGGLVEVGRQFKAGPMASMYHLDPTRCILTPNVEAPLKYWPARPGRTGSRVLEFTPPDYMRATSGINVDESFNGLGYSALSRCIELAITMVAVYRHEQEMLFARAPKGLLLLKGISQTTWNNAMKVRGAALDQREQEWFGAVAVLASSGADDVDAKLVALSQLPEGFDQKLFTDLLIYGYSLCFGYDPREFWPVSSGALGTATETEAQHRKATGKGGKEFTLAFQEELQSNLPDTLHFEFKERDVQGELSEALLAKAKVDVVQAMYGAQNPTPLLTQAQALHLLAEEGVIPREWSETAQGDVEVDDTEATRERMLEYPEVQRALQTFPVEPLVIYEYPSGKIRELSPMRDRTMHPVAKIMQRLAKEMDEHGEGIDVTPKVENKMDRPVPIIPPVVTPVPAPVIQETILERIQTWMETMKEKNTAPPQPINVTVNNHPAVPVVAQPSSIEVHNYLDGKKVDPEEEARKRQELTDELSKIMKENQNVLTRELTEYLKANQEVLTSEGLADLKKNQDVLAAEVLERLRTNLDIRQQEETIKKKVKTKSILDTIRRLANGK